VATNIHPICQPITSGQVFPIGNTTIVCTAKDNSNNTAKASFVVLVKNKEAVSTRSNGFILAIILIIIAGAIAAAIFIYRRSRQEKYSI
jgi:subtilase family serine protease